MDIIIPLIIALINCIIIFVYVLVETFKLTKFKSDLYNDLNNIENIHAKLRDNHLGTEVIIKYDDHYKLNWDEVSSRLNIFGGYSWRKFGYETFIQPVGFGIFH